MQGTNQVAMENCAITTNFWSCIDVFSSGPGYYRNITFTGNGRGDTNGYHLAINADVDTDKIGITRVLNSFFAGNNGHIRARRAYNWTITGNTFHNLSRANYDWSIQMRSALDWNLYPPYSPQLTIVNNTFVGPNQYYGIYVWGGFNGNYIIRNNTFSNLVRVFYIDTPSNNYGPYKGPYLYFQYNTIDPMQCTWNDGSVGKFFSEPKFFFFFFCFEKQILISLVFSKFF